jgi:HTH-type transcriptional regulator / antitoxin HipB
MPAQVVKIVKDFGTQVKKERQRLCLTQARAAGLIGVGVRFLSEPENGKETLEFGKVLRVLQALKIQVYLEMPQDPLEAENRPALVEREVNKSDQTKKRKKP